ncbi:hypothetical protein OEZ86_013500 [Tetradesmus obliquus]|nr:hypothetical protein OEZ86_013500 [Tetradesmus obliquus]
MALLHFPKSLNACSRRGNASIGTSVSVLNVPSVRCAAPALHRAQASSRRQFVYGAAATAEPATSDAAGVQSSDAADTLPQAQAQQQQQRKAPKQQQEREKAIIVGEKPAANSLLRRLEQVPQTTLRAMSSSDQHTYKAISTVAIAQGLLQDPTKAVRQQMLTRGYELGVMPRFEEQRITVLCQQVVLQELPVPRVTLPRTDAKPLDAAAAAANAMLAKQRRVQLLLPPTQLPRLSGMLHQIIQPAAAAATPAAAAAAAAAAGEEKAEQQQAPRGRGRGGWGQQEKRRLLLVWPPSTADQLLESLEQLNQFATAAMAEEAPAAAAAAAAAPAAAPAAPAALDAAAAASDVAPLLQLQLRRSRLTSIPTPQDSSLSGAGIGADRKPAVATAESSVSGLAGAIEARVSRAGAAWLWSDGSEQAQATAWQALLLASSKMDAADGAGGLLALVDVQPLQQQQQQQQAAAQQQEPPQADAQPEQQQQQQQRGRGGQQRGRRQQQQQQGQGQGQGYKLKMLIVRDSDIARSILQSPNAPLEVSVTADLWPLLKFATAANTFLPVTAAAGTGALVMLPAVLPAVPAEPAPVAVDYRFDDAKQQLVPYAIRLQRFTGSLPEGMEVNESNQLRVSLSTDPIKLRDAIVAKVLQQQPASVRFVGPLGRAPPLLTIAMAAVAAARVRLQQKGAPMDVGVMPYAETLLGPAAAAAAGGVEGAEEKTLNKYFTALVAGSNAPKVGLSQGSAGLGLVAVAPIAAKEAVLVIPEANSLTVPEAQGSSVFAWETKWLAPFEEQHGPLPPALAYFLSDRDGPALARLSTLILYIRKYAQSDLWKGWLALLPSLQSASYPGGPWTAAEVQQLQLEPLKMLVADNHAYYASEAQQLFTFLTQDPDQLGLQQLQLADSVEDCMWAQFIAATRGSDAGIDDSSLHPLHDLTNHSDAPNCAAGVSTEAEGFFVQAAADIEPGSELTLCR